ncbi:GNAT family N-acetyltransferase [Flavobacterium sp. JP2137]|uniref:GNAT family N-acetyltransferase n=1 Tax=Flavobacterium sp. JP2137 TaxID=3414510 RepID=UPI003D2FEB38
MMTLKGNLVYLRALEPEDLEFIYQLENQENLWEVSNTQTPYSRFLIHQYLENAHQDIYESKQLRMVICSNSSAAPLGLIDLFDFDPKNQRAGIGIVINNPENRLQGVGSEALELLINYAFYHLQLHQLYANISTDNLPSERLFTKFGFSCVGIKKEWNRVGTQRKDEALYQLLNTKK